MTIAPFQKPSPDWDMVTLYWAGVYLDGTPATGSIELEYESTVPMLDDDPTMPLSVFPSRVTIPIQSTTLLIGGESRQVGYVAVAVPASNDPDIQGSGGTYKFSERLTKGGGRTGVSFVADKDAPGGVIWLNKVPGAASTPGEPLSVVYWADFQALDGRVEALETDGGAPAQHRHSLDDTDNSATRLAMTPAERAKLAATSGTNTGDQTWGTLGGKPTTFAPSTHQHPTTDITGFTAAVDARVQNIVGAAPAALDTLSELADALGDDANFAATMTTALAGKSATGHTHTKSEVGLSNVDNTSDANKPVSAAQALALSGKADVVVYTGGNLTYKGATIASWPAGLTGPVLVLGYTSLASVPAWVPDTALVIVDSADAGSSLGRLAGITNSTGTTFTPALSDEGKLVTLANAGTITVTLPTDASVAIPVGGQVHFAQRGSGGLTFAAASGATINPSSATTAATNSVVTAIKIAANVWLLTGALT